MAKVDFTPAVVLMVMTLGVFVLRYAGTPSFKQLLGQIDQFISQTFSIQPTQAQTPSTTTPTPTTTTPAPAACDCTCMPMDSDPNRFKIETAAGEDCYNNVYPDTMEACQQALVGVCAQRGGTTPAPAPTTPAGRTTPNCNAEENTCLCPGSTAWFQMGEARDCDDCVAECEARARGENIGDEDDDDDDDDNGGSSGGGSGGGGGGGSRNTPSEYANTVRNRCGSFSGETRLACERSLVAGNRARTIRFANIARVFNVGNIR